MRVFGEWIKWILIISSWFLMYRYIDKNRLIYVSNRALPPQEAAIINGMVLGDKAGFEKEFYNQLKDSGLIHLMVVSGSNLILLSEGLIGVFAGWLGRKKTIIWVMGLIVGYTAMLDWQLPMVRALLMLAIMYLAQLLGRKYSISRSLLVTVIIMVLADARVLKEFSFWMSVVAMIGVVTARGRWWMEVWWVNLWVLPLVGIISGRLSWTAPITNLLVIGMVGIIVGGGLVGLMVGQFYMVLGELILRLMWPMLNYLSLIVELGSKGGVISLRFNWFLVIGWYLILIYLIGRRNRNEMAMVAN